MSVHAESLLARSNSEPDMLSTAKQCKERYFPVSVHAESLLGRSNSQPDMLSRTAKQSMTGDGAVCQFRPLCSNELLRQLTLSAQQKGKAILPRKSYYGVSGLAVALVVQFFG
jgi:hypothetical protein